MVDRRDLLKLVGAGAGGLLATGGAGLDGGVARIVVRRECPDSLKTRLAVRELRAGLVALGLAREVVEGREAQAGAPLVVLRIDGALGGEAHQASATKAGVILSAGNEQALLYAVFDFLERQGMTFGLDGGLAPIDRPAGLQVPRDGEVWRSNPRFSTRGLLPWPDFLNCVSVYNDEDFKAYFAAMLRMRFNMFGMHVYTDAEQPTESYLSFDFAGAGHRAELETSATQGWGYLPQRTSTYRMGAAQFFDRETFGSDAARLAADNWEVTDRTTALMRSGLEFARDLGIRTGIGFEPYKLPSAISQALPPEAALHPGGFAESATAKALLERRLADLLERYPSVDYVWLWEDETSNWQSRAQNVPISTTAFVQAHDFLRRHAPEKRLVAAGWGGFTRNFAELHRRLPGDIIFAALSNTLGGDPVHEAFGQLGERERWPIPWLEDDPSMWFPQFRAGRFETDLRRAQDMGCQGVMGIHWRHRIVDPTATYLSRASWDAGLTARTHYARYARSQATARRAPELAALLVDCDSGGAISSTFTGKLAPGGFVEHVEMTADYNEAFNYQKNEPQLALLPRQRQTAARFEALARAATTALERERLGYLAGFVGLMPPYCDAYENAHKLDAVLVRATALRKAGQADQAKALVAAQGVPLWIALAAQVRAAILAFQAVIATRNDQGQMASMQNKLVRIALERLKLSLLEFLGEAPAEVERAYAAAIAPDDQAPARVFLPTRPTTLVAGQALRLFVVAPGFGPDASIVFSTRALGQSGWTSTRATHEGRGVHSAALGPYAATTEMVEYRVEALEADKTASDPPGGAVHIATVLG